MADTISTDELFDDTNVEEVTDEEKNVLEDLEEEASPDELLAALANATIDAEELARQEAELYLEAGDYYFLKGHTVTISSNSKDKAPKDILPHGRTMVNVSGQVRNHATGKQGMFRFTFSPDMRYQREKDGNGNLIVKQPQSYDMFFQAYLKVAEFFFKKFERTPKNQGELVAMLKAGSFLMYISRGKQGGNFLGQFKTM